MGVYGGIDLHSSNCWVAVVDEGDRAVRDVRLPNDLEAILVELAAYRDELRGIVVESTFNWYWLVDGLMEAGYEVHLANTAAIRQYAGLKYTDDRSDARWLAHLLRIGALREGYIYPKQERAVRDLLRKRSLLVRHRVMHVLSIQNLLARNLGRRFSLKTIMALEDEDVGALLPNADHALAVNATLSVLRCLTAEIHRVEQAIRADMKGRADVTLLRSVDGIGSVLALTIALETGDIGRFATVGQFASYCRCVDSSRLSNGKRKGEGNTKNGNRYLAWAFVEAANFAIRHNERIRRFYDRKKARKNRPVAVKAVAHKLARACYHMLRDQTPFDVKRAFA